MLRSILFSFRLDLASELVPFWLHSGSELEQFWCHFGSVFVPYTVRFAKSVSILAQVLQKFVLNLGHGAPRHNHAQ